MPLDGVSIPNGMEFYARTFKKGMILLRFNSQQDGIPLKILNEKL